MNALNTLNIQGLEFDMYQRCMKSSTTTTLKGEGIMPIECIIFIGNSTNTWQREQGKREWKIQKRFYALSRTRDEGLMKNRIFCHA